MRAQEMMLFFQSPVDHSEWSLQETEMLLSEGFMWKALFGGAPSHLAATPDKIQSNART